MFVEFLTTELPKTLVSTGFMERKDVAYDLCLLVCVYSCPSMVPYSVTPTRESLPQLFPEMNHSLSENWNGCIQILTQSSVP
jgi:hypothetical protein